MNTTTQSRQQVGAISYICSWKVMQRSLTIAAVVGCLLSLINQWEALLSGPYTARLALKILMNFCIPFVVSSVSAAANRPGR